MKKKLLSLLKVVGVVAGYCALFTVAVYLSMQTLIKGEELEAPSLIGKSLREASEEAATRDIYLKEVRGNYGRHYKPLTVISQVPDPGIRIKAKSFIKVFVTSDVVRVRVPELCGYSLAESEKLLMENNLRKRYVSYMDAEDAPVDFVIAQSYPPGSRVPRGTEIDILLSRGNREQSFIMSDVIGKRAPDVLAYFRNLGLNINSTPVSYPGVGPGTVVKQYPKSGYPINTRARISIEVSQ